MGGVPNPGSGGSVMHHQGTSADYNPSEPGRRKSVPSARIVAVEHPCIVKDVDKALKALGGEHQIKILLHESDKAPSIRTTLRPDDLFAKAIKSKPANVQHVLLRVSVPRKTGRKRKRGSDDSFEYHDGQAPQNGNATQSGPLNAQSDLANQMPLTPQQVVGRLASARDHYTTEPISLITKAHRFRALPDFQHVSQDNDLMQQIARHLTTSDLDIIKRFQPRMTSRDVPVHMPGPPSLASYTHPLYYGYAQNTQLRPSQPAASALSASLAPAVATRRRQDNSLQHDAPSVPTAPPASLPPLSSCTSSMRQAVSSLRNVLESRPIITRRAAMNLCPSMGEDLFKAATEYAGYAFRSGPWRDALVRFGLDPRTDPQYRIYQTLSFQLSTKDKDMAAAKRLPTGSSQWLRSYKVARGKKSIRLGANASSPSKTAEGGTEEEALEGTEEVPSHVFDGYGLGTNNKTFQLLDIVDPLLRGVLDTAPVREKFESSLWGWYTNGTLAVIRILMREKMARLLSLTPARGPEVDALLERVVKASPALLDRISVQTTYDVDVKGLDAEGKELINRLMAGIRDVGKRDLDMWSPGDRITKAQAARWGKDKGKEQGQDGEGDGKDVDRIQAESVDGGGGGGGGGGGDGDGFCGELDPALIGNEGENDALADLEAEEHLAE